MCACGLPSTSGRAVISRPVIVFRPRHHKHRGQQLRVHSELAVVDGLAGLLPLLDQASSAIASSSQTLTATAPQLLKPTIRVLGKDLTDSVALRAGPDSLLRLGVRRRDECLSRGERTSLAAAGCPLCKMLCAGAGMHCWYWHAQISLLTPASFAPGHLVLLRHKVDPRRHICFGGSHLVLQQLQQTDLFSQKHLHLCSELKMPSGHCAFAQGHLGLLMCSLLRGLWPCLQAQPLFWHLGFLCAQPCEQGSQPEVASGEPAAARTPGGWQLWPGKH